jgi:hypothetical protein
MADDDLIPLAVKGSFTPPPTSRTARANTRPIVTADAVSMVGNSGNEATGWITPQKKAKPKSADQKPGRSIDPAIDRNLIPPAGQLRLSSSYHPLKKHTDHERDAQQNAGYQKERRKRISNKRESSIPGMQVPDPISIVHLHLSDFEIKMVIEVSKVLAKHGRDDETPMTPREYLEWVSELAKPLFIDLLKERLKGRK